MNVVEVISDGFYFQGIESGVVPECEFGVVVEQDDAFGRLTIDELLQSVRRAGVWVFHGGGEVVQKGFDEMQVFIQFGLWGVRGERDAQCRRIDPLLRGIVDDGGGSGIGRGCGGPGDRAVRQRSRMHRILVKTHRQKIGGGVITDPHRPTRRHMGDGVRGFGILRRHGRRIRSRRRGEEFGFQDINFMG